MKNVKICNKCETEKELSEFYKDKTHSDGYTSSCKICKNKYHKNWVSNNVKLLNEYNKIYHTNNKTKHNKNAKIYYKNNKKEHRRLAKLWYESNKKSINEYMKKYNIERRKLDPLFRLISSSRTLVNVALKENGYKKLSKTETILGCSFQNFKMYLESKFQPWMNWDNYGLYNGELNYGWDIDHIIPISTAKSEDDIIKLSHYTNLQPLCSKVNRYIKKNNTE